MLRRLKGWGKDPVGSAWLANELCGICRPDGLDASGRPVGKPHPSPWVMTAAVSLDQTKNTMRLFPGLLSDDAIAEYGIDLGKEIIYTRNGMLEAVTSSPRAMEGKRATATLKNETHHWLENNDGIAMSEVIARNLTKARGGDARALAISNAHNPGEGSDAESDSTPTWPARPAAAPTTSCTTRSRRRPVSTSRTRSRSGRGCSPPAVTRAGWTSTGTSRRS
jgi:hypothetical protein